MVFKELKILFKSFVLDCGIIRYNNIHTWSNSPIERTYLMSGEKATQRTADSWPVSSARGATRLRLQTRTVGWWPSCRIHIPTFTTTLHCKINLKFTWSVCYIQNQNHMVNVDSTVTDSTNSRITGSLRVPRRWRGAGRHARRPRRWWRLGRDAPVGNLFPGSGAHLPAQRRICINEIHSKHNIMEKKSGKSRYWINNGGEVLSLELL